MTPERILLVVKKLREIASTNFSDYAGFHMEVKPGIKYNHCFIVNDQPYHSSNFTIELENLSDAVKIIQKFNGQTKEEVVQELEHKGFLKNYSPIYLHYLKLIRNCED